MESRLYQFGLLALYQLSLLVGIFLLPVALVVRKFGVRLPVHRVVLWLGEAHERSHSN